MPLIRPLFAATLLLAPGLAAQVPISRGWALDRDGALKIFNPVGSIRVIGWERDSVAVSGMIAKGAAFFGGGSRRGVKLGVEGDQGSTAMSSALTVHVPAGANVWVRGAATDITVEGLTGGVDVGSVGGEVRVTGAPRDLLAESMDGGVEIVGSPGILRAKTASGALRWTGDASDATLGSVSGRIHATGGPLGRVRIETISGDVLLDAILRADADIVVESHSGAVELRVPAGVPARLTVDAARVTGDAMGGARPSAGKRAEARSIEINSPRPGVAAATITVRSFKGEFRLLAPKAAPPKD